MRNLLPIKRNRDLTLFGEFGLGGIFEDFFKTSFPSSLFSHPVVPALDVYEKANKVIVKTELPGVKPEEVDLSVDGDLLIIRGEKKRENEVKEGDYHRTERSYGSFQRAVKLPSGVKADEAKATYKNGVLEIELEKSQEDRKKKIKIDVK